MKFVLMLVCVVSVTNICVGTNSTAAPTSTESPSTPPPTESPTTAPPTESPTTAPPTESPTTPHPTTPHQTTPHPTTPHPTTSHPTTPGPTTQSPTTTDPPTTQSPTTTNPPTTQSPTTTDPPTTQSPTTIDPPTTQSPTTTDPPTTQTPTTTEDPITTQDYDDDDDHDDNCTISTGDPCNCTEPTAEPTTPPPDVLQAKCVYSRSNRTLTCTVGDETVTVTGVIIPTNGRDETQEFGETPTGEYAIEEMIIHPDKKKEWHRLHYKLDCGKYWSYNYRNEDVMNNRCGIGLHPGVSSDGCITIPQADWAKVRDLLKKAQSVKHKLKMPGCLPSTQKIIGTLTVYH